MYFITKNVVLNWYSSVKKKFRKIRMIFDIENWLWKSDLGTFWWPMWTSVKVKSKNYFSFTDFLLKSSPCWLTSAKLHHWGHTNIIYQIITTYLAWTCAIILLIWPILEPRVEILQKFRSLFRRFEDINISFWY